jgi:hypothetical protein
MTFFIVTGRALRQWFFFWNIYKIPYKWAKYRATFGFMTVTFLWVSSLIFYYGGYLPYQDVNYPPLSKMNVDSGVFKTVKKQDILFLPDGREIVLGGIHQYEDYREQYRVKGSIESPVFFVKVWWFPLTHSKEGWIGQMEINGKIIASYEEKYQDFLYQKDPTKYTSFLKFFFTIFLVLFLWELLSQYINYRQEHNVRKRSE